MQLKDASILVVDDEEVLRDYLGRWFEREGSTVHRAANGKEALDVLGTRHVDLVVSDIRMPVLDGVGMLRAMRVAGKSQPSVIFVSGYNDYPERELFDLGAEALLEKPFDRKHLMAAVVQSLAERQDLWRIPIEGAVQATLRYEFASVSGAIEEGKIAFGRGGLSLATHEVLPTGPVGLELRFRDDGYVLAGRGIVRWMEAKEMQAGIEFSYVDEESRAVVVAISGACTGFIPAMADHQARYFI